MSSSHLIGATHGDIQQDRTYGDFAALKARHPNTFGKTKAYSLLKQKGGLRAKKFGSKTLWDLTSADEYLASLPDFGEAG